VVLVESGLSIAGAVLGVIGATAVELLVYRRYMPLRLFPKSAYPAARLWNQATPLFFSAVCFALFSRVDLFALTALGLPTSEAGYYAAAQNLSIIPGLFAASFSPLLLATLSGMKKKGEHESARIMSRDSMRLVLGMLPFAAMASGAAREIVVLVFGANFAPAASLLAWLIFAKVAAVMISVAVVIMIVADRPGLSFALAGPMLAMAISGHIVLVPAFGSMGAAWVTLSLDVAGALAALALVHRVQDVRAPMATVGRTLLIAGVAWLLAALVPAPGFWVIAKLALLAVAVALGYARLGEFKPTEIAWVLTFVRLRLKPWSGRS
jgi:O-antigen/teichoic acid export membrane protein